MKSIKDVVITDRVFPPNRKLSATDRFFAKMLRDDRDLPFLYLIFQISLTIVPMGIGLYFLEGWLWWTVAISYFVLNGFIYRGPYGLMLHCTSHRKMFRPKFEFLSGYIPTILGPFFGQSPGTYYSHHIHMHHAENNLPDDLSTTMNYQRDSFKDFMRYFADFLFDGIRQLTSYFRAKNRSKLYYKVLLGEIGFYAGVIALSYVSFWSTFFVFWFPFISTRFIMMLGNFTQHAFIDPAQPGNSMRNSLTCLNVKYNYKCWNDGYHISHHVRPHMHWSEHPIYFQKTIQEYRENKSVVVDGLDFLQVFIALMNKRYDKLAKHLVNFGDFETEEEAIAFLQSRTKKMCLKDYRQQRPSNVEQAEQAAEPVG